MTMTIEPAQLAEQGKQAFRNKQFDESAELFRQAAEGFSLGRNGLLAAEMKNNMSVALLQAGKAQESLDAALGTDLVFAGAKDIKSQGMALGNQAAALEALNRFDEAIAAYTSTAHSSRISGSSSARAPCTCSIPRVPRPRPRSPSRRKSSGGSRRPPEPAHRIFASGSFAFV